MKDNLRLVRPFLVLLVLFTVGRWVMGVRGVPYDRGHHVFSLVTLTAFAAVFYGAFTRQWLRHPVSKAMAVGATIGLAAQLAILLGTLLSFALGIDTYFTHPRAVTGEFDRLQPVTIGEALVSRIGGGVVNVLGSALMAAIGWFMGKVLPPATLAAAK
jgi:hypothetical protein